MSGGVFHINLFGRYGLLCFVVSALFFWILWSLFESLWVLLAVLVLYSATSWATYSICIVAVGDKGITIYRVNKARWEEVIEARKVSFLGLPYLKVLRKKQKGFGWWIPLYLTRPDDFHCALAAKAPAGNPLKEYADQVIGSKN